MAEGISQGEGPPEKIERELDSITQWVGRSDYFMQPSLRRYYSLAVATLGFVVLGVSLFNYATISSLVSHQFGLSDTDSGLLTSVFALTYLIMQIPTGLLSDRIGGAKTLLIALSITTIAPLFFIFGNSFEAALVSRAIAGVGTGISSPPTSGWSPPRSRRGRNCTAPWVFSGPAGAAPSRSPTSCSHC